MKISIKLGIFAIGCSNVATGAPAADGVGEGVGNSRAGGATVRWGLGAIVGGGSTVGVCSTSKNRPSHHKYKSQKQFELKQS